jgi:hypothetical protein
VPAIRRDEDWKRGEHRGTIPDLRSHKPPCRPLHYAHHKSGWRESNPHHRGPNSACYHKHFSLGQGSRTRTDASCSRSTRASR